ncbi:hypothetical protein FRB90_000503 [Tulasnella sp. 427]|nr:hypothetical protein FRB90_000503 [Tulasnella sp. 427]
MEAWRTQPDYSLMGLQERAKSTIITPGSAAPGEQWIQACTDAMRSRLHLAHTQYAAWSQAAALFADLDRMGATTAPAVLKILKKDNTMLGRLVAVLCAVIELGRWQQGKLPQVLTSSEYLRPYFHRTRDQTGISKVYTNNDFATRAKMPVESIECLLAHWLRLGGQKYGGAPLLAELHKRTLDPMEAAKLTAEALETIANLVEEATRTGGSKTWESQCTAILPQKLKPDESINLMKIRFPSFAQYERLYRQQSLTWLSVIWKLECRDLLRMLLETDVWRVEHYDFMWFTLDTLLWEGASRLERKPGRLGKLYELISPDAKQRPLATRHYWDEVLKSLEEQTVDERRKREEEELRASYVQEIPTATPQESIAKAPERSEEQLKPKTRKRRKGKGDQAHPDLTSAPTEAATEPQATPSNAPVRQDVPDILPKGWKLGRKTVDIFNRLLDPKEKSGQIRWADFETAMQQIGFNVVQTEGSSVRFDPPAIRARPITFHRIQP